MSFKKMCCFSFRCNWNKTDKCITDYQNCENFKQFKENLLKTLTPYQIKAEFIPFEKKQLKDFKKQLNKVYKK